MAVQVPRRDPSVSAQRSAGGVAAGAPARAGERPHAIKGACGQEKGQAQRGQGKQARLALLVSSLFVGNACRHHARVRAWKSTQVLAPQTTKDFRGRYSTINTNLNSAEHEVSPSNGDEPAWADLTRPVDLSSLNNMLSTSRLRRMHLPLLCRFTVF